MNYKEIDIICISHYHTDHISDLIGFVKNSDALILECSYPNDQKVAGHLVSKECGEIAKKANVMKLVLSHLYPTSPEEIRLNETKEFFSNTILAEDLINLDI